MTIKRRPISLPTISWRRSVVWLGVVVVLLVHAAWAFFAWWWEEELIAFGSSGCQAGLIAVGVAWCEGSLLKRWLLGLLLLVWLWLMVIWVESNFYGDTDAFILGNLYWLVSLFLYACVVSLLPRLWLRWRLVLPDAIAAGWASSRQFHLRDLLVLVTLVAITLAAARTILGRLTSLTFDAEFAFALAIFGLEMLVSLVAMTAWAVVLSQLDLRRWLIGVLIAPLWLVACSGLQSYASPRVFGWSYPIEMREFLWLNVVILAIVHATMLSLRLLGFRFVRRPKDEPAGDCLSPSP